MWREEERAGLFIISISLIALVGLLVATLIVRLGEIAHLIELLFYAIMSS